MISCKFVCCILFSLMRWWAGVNDRLNLVRLYDVGASAIRAVDGDHLMFYESATWSVFSTLYPFSNGFVDVPGGDRFRAKSVLSVHYYCVFTFVGEMPYVHKCAKFND